MGTVGYQWATTAVFHYHLPAEKIGKFAVLGKNEKGALQYSSLDVSPLACSQTGRGSLLHQEQEKQDFVQLTYKLNSFFLQRILQDIPVILVQVQISLSCILILTESDILNVHNMHLYLFLYKFIQTIKLLAIRFGCRLYEVQLRAHYTADILHIQNRKESTC